MSRKIFQIWNEIYFTTRSLDNQVLIITGQVNLLKAPWMAKAIKNSEFGRSQIRIRILYSKPANIDAKITNEL
jgi:hypothetical protein